MFARLLVLCTALFSAPVFAAVIFSSCPVQETKTSPGKPAAKVDRFKPADYANDLVRYSQQFPHAVRYTRWLFSGEPDTSKFHDSDPAAAETGLWIEDIELLRALSEDEPDCHAGENVITQAVAIFPFAVRSKDVQGVEQYRVRYKTCEYYVDQDRQLPIEDACTVIGRQSGYTFAELSARFNQLDAHVKEGKNFLEAGVVGAALIAAIPIFRGLRLLKASSLASLAGAIAPAGLAYYGIRENFTDALIRDAIDFRDANEIALTGDLSTSVKVNMPMQRFVPYFIRYLDSLK